MAYCTLDDLLSRFGDDEVYVAFDRDNDGEVETSAVDQALADADEEINTYLAARYALPLANIPAVLVRLAAQMAIYHGSIGTAITEEKRKRYEDAVKMLNKISRGDISLGLAAAEEPANREQITVQSSTKLFPDDELEMF